jgi:hypothetical protein
LESREYRFLNQCTTEVVLRFALISMLLISSTNFFIR